jgi:alpha-glucosidase
VIGNHDVARPASRYRLEEGFTPQTVSRLIALGDQDADAGTRRARAAALVLLALPGSAYIYQGEELGLPEVTDIGADARQDPRFFRTNGENPGRDGCRVPLPWSGRGTGFGFSRTGDGARPAEPWLPQPADWGRYSVESQLADEHSTLNLYRSALRLRRDHPALGRGASGRDAQDREALRWLGPDDGGLLCFAREPGFILAANLGPAPAPLPAHREVLLTSGPVAGGSLPPDTAAWLCT